MLFLKKNPKYWTWICHLKYEVTIISIFSKTKKTDSMYICILKALFFLDKNEDLDLKNSTVSLGAICRQFPTGLIFPFMCFVLKPLHFFLAYQGKCMTKLFKLNCWLLSVLDIPFRWQGILVAFLISHFIFAPALKKKTQHQWLGFVIWAACIVGAIHAWFAHECGHEQTRYKSTVTRICSSDHIYNS